MAVLCTSDTLAGGKLKQGTCLSTNACQGKELSDESGRDCPFFEELDAIFKERARNVDRMLLESEGGGGITSAGGELRRYD